MMISSLAMVLLQDAPDVAHQLAGIKLFTAVVAVGFLLQGLAMLIIAIVVIGLVKKVKGMIDDVEKKTTPIITKASTLVNDLTPKITAITGNVEQISYTVRAKADEIADTVTQVNKTVQQMNVTVQDINLRTRGQVARVDGMVTDALTTTHEVSTSIQEGIRRPVRKLAEMIHGMKATMEGFAAKAPFLHRQPKQPKSPYDF